ncbi:hypothetical protein ASPVEDRAFT_156080 [Aspergillus versicolor CBS 583.65]|uniref:F-box domain-containing protein n=1 Tax=Aspergillus versicolor CBS 583.65 TaxID=1036611 RepID=A0A1L9Q3V9_ASPVE|nr:uncharacterized protein ASPVEDRAFT_156080 [Aspergillus versicolor CBS 583.65]OJJ08426.1 hypothetical protein ASPVEDRAFT_156080 [Aspergillus versicolor CBS 583.65]
MKKWCNPSDSFRCLPQELRHAIVQSLPTWDFLNLRLASRTMTGLFNEGYFWRSRFEYDGDRGFLHHILRDHGEDVQIDWRLLYHASAELENRFDLTVPVWETVRWIQDTVKADEGSMEPPLGFYGRSLQDYHNDTCAAGRRVERVRVPSSLAKIEVSFKFAELKPHPTEILALELIDKDGTSMTVGSKYFEVDISKCRELFSEFNKSQEAKCRLDCAGLHALFDAQSFVGFRISYNAQAIYRIGILNRHHKSKAQPEILGYEPDGCSGFDMGLNEVVQVVATFESYRLVGLGLRGSGNRNSMYGRRPIINPKEVDAKRYGWQFDEGADYTWLFSD